MKSLLSFFMTCSVALGLSGLSFAQSNDFDPVAWKRGGLRGAVIGPASSKHPFQSEGSTIRLKDGALVHVFNLREKPAGVKEWHVHTSLTYIAKVVSRDGGKSWSAPEIMFRSSTGPTVSHPSFARLQNGELAITYNHIDSPGDDKTKREDWVQSVTRAYKVFRYSNDEGRSWSREITITPTDGYWTSAHDRMTVLSSGRVLQPLHTIFSKLPIRIGARVAYSDDHGRTWKITAQTLVGDVLAESADKLNESSRGNESGFWEVSVAERADGSLLMIGRTHVGLLYYSTSNDQGATWSKPAPTQLASTEAPARLARVPNSGDLLLIWNSCCIDRNDTLLGQRLTLTAAISRDGGATWQGRRELVNVDAEPGGTRHGACYPSIYFNDRNVLVSYHSGAKVGGATWHQQYMAVLPLSWFYVEPGEKNNAADTGQANDARQAPQVDTAAVIYNMGGIRGAIVGPADAKHPYQSEGTTIRLKDGSVMHAFNLRSQPEAGQKWHAHYVPTQIAYAVTKDKGRTWSSPQVLLSSPTRTASHPALVRLPNGDLGVTYNRIVGEMEATKVFRSSKDEGRTWSDEILISPATGYWTSAHDRLIAHSSGRLLQPLHNKEILKPEKMVTYVAWSDDNGKTWQMGKQALVVPITVPEFKANHGQSRGDGFWEVSIAERADKSLYMIGRTRTGYLYESISTNKGETWTEPKRTALVSNEAPAFVARVPGTNDLLLVWNSCCIDPKHWGLGLRLTLSAVISTDGGKTWNYRREVASVAPRGPAGSNDDGVAYPSVYIDDGLVYVGYFARMRGEYQGGGGGGGPQIVATLPLSWFYAERDYHRPEVLKAVETKQ